MKQLMNRSYLQLQDELCAVQYNIKVYGRDSHVLQLAADKTDELQIADAARNELAKAAIAMDLAVAEPGIAWQWPCYGQNGMPMYRSDFDEETSEDTKWVEEAIQGNDGRILNDCGPIVDAYSLWV